METEAYKRYLRSEHWETLRMRIRKRDNYRCFACPSVVDEVHHINYRSLYDVKDEDLICTCQPCHAAIHKAVVAGYIPDPHANRSSLPLTKAGLERYKRMRDPLGERKGTVLSFEFLNRLNQVSAIRKGHVWRLIGIPQKPSVLDLEGHYVSKKQLGKLVNIIKRETEKVDKPSHRR